MFKKNIKYLRDSRNMTQSELAKAMGYKASATISKWEREGFRPKATELEKLASIFNVSVEDLLYTDLQRGKNPDTAIQAAVRINVLGSVPAGIPVEAVEDICGFEDIPAEWLLGGREYFALRVDGDSMYPKYESGDIVIVRKQPDCENGQDAVVYVNGDNATLKRIYKQETGILLQPLNPAYEPHTYRYDDLEHPVTIAGVVVEIRRSV
jgi:repressor LexA